MQKPASYYVALGRNAACAHKLVMTAGGQDVDRAIAADFFRQLWAALDRETLQDHCDARAAFNDAFRVACRGLPAVPPEAPAPRQFNQPPALCHEGRCTRGCAGKCLAPAPALKASASAAACAAFFNAKVGA